MTTLPPNYMYALVKTKPEKGFDYTQLPIPVPKDDELIIKVEMISLCGSDITMYKWEPKHIAENISTIPFTPGHEGTGIVVAKGSKVRGIEIGDRVCPETHVPCGKCYQCTHGQQHICQHMVLFGHQLPGCCAQYAPVPMNAVYKLTTNIPPRLACLLEPFGVAYRTVEETNPTNDTLLVIGCGPIGLAAIGLAKQVFKAAKIIGLDIVDVRLNVAKVMGADTIINSTTYLNEKVANNDVGLAQLKKHILEETNGDGVGCIIEASGSPIMVNSCSSWIRKGGRMVLVGLPKSDIVIKDPCPNFIFKELTLKTLHGRKMYDTWEKLEKILAEGKVNFDPIITHTFPMSKIDAAFQSIFDGIACKVQVDPSK